MDKIEDALDKNEYVLGIFLDITKAFDSVNHEYYTKNWNTMDSEDTSSIW